MKTISAHLPADLEDDLDTYADSEMIDRSAAVQKLLAEGLAKWRREKAITRLRDEEVTFVRAAGMAQMNVWHFAELVAEHEVEWLSESHLEADLESLDEENELNRTDR